MKHPVNLAYEAATADLRDVNMIDPYHLEQYGVTTVNYNRDIEAFPVVKTVLSRVLVRMSIIPPTDMGVNMAGYAITDDAAVRAAANQEIIRRYFKACCDARQGLIDSDIPERVGAIMQQLGLREEDRPVVQQPAINRHSVRCRQLLSSYQMDVLPPDGPLFLMSAAASGVINAIKALWLAFLTISCFLPLALLEPIMKMKHDILHVRDSSLTLEDVLIALSLCGGYQSYCLDGNGAVG